MTSKIRLPLLLFAYTAIVLVALYIIYSLYLELLSTQRTVEQLKEELEKMNRYAAAYNTSAEIIGTVFRESENCGIIPSVMLELIKAESNYRPDAVSSEGARGLCQIKPVTAKELCKELNLEFKDELLDEPRFNIRLGAFYLAKLLAMHDNDYHKALTAYNRGPAGLKRYIKLKGTAESSYSQKISRNSLLAELNP